MSKEIKIDIDTFKVVTRAVAQSDNLEIMAGHLAQLLVGMLGIKGCSIFARNVETDELEPVATFGLSMQYLNKGPVLSEKSISRTIKGEPIVISDIKESDMLQYPREAEEEGIRAVVSLPIQLYGRVIGALDHLLLVWDEHTRTMAVVESDRGAVKTSVELPDVQHLKMSGQDLYAAGNDGRVIRLVPRN